MGQFERYLGKKLDGRYELREIIGIGGMAVVYLAHDLQADRMVAVKLLRDEYLANDEFRRRFKTESKAISLMSHPNIVKVFDVCLGDRLQYIVMEYIDGITIKEFIEMQKTLSVKDSVYFLSQILSALVHAHGHGIVHRDIKPQNLLLMSNGQIKVTDFGIARFTRNDADSTANQAIGSVHYLSPEQARGDAVDARADLYSTGIVMYEMLTGRLPFESENPVQIAVMQMQDKETPIRSINPGLPVALEEICSKAMRKNPAERYGSAAEMLAALEEYKKNPAVVFNYKYDQVSAPPPAEVTESLKKTGKTKKEEKVRRYRTRWLSLLFGITIAVIVGTVVFVGGTVLLKTTLFTPTGEELDLPNFVGQNYYDVIADENYSKLVIVYDDNSQYNNDYPSGVIYEQIPKPPKKVKAGSEISVKVSRGPELVPIPDFSGRERNAAVTAIEKLGLFARVIEQFSSDSPSGYVLSTDPAPNTEISLGGTVTLYIAVNVDTKAVEVPFEVVNTSISEATRTLVKSGLQAGSIIYAASALPAETVMSTSPEPGTLVASGTVVDIIVSNGAFYFDTRQTMDVYLTNLPQRSFAYLIEVYINTDEAPLVAAAIPPGSDSLRVTIEQKNGTDTLRIMANGQLLRDVVVNYDDVDYYQRGVDYAVDLSPGYVSADFTTSSAASSYVSSYDSSASSAQSSAESNYDPDEDVFLSWPFGSAPSETPEN